MSTDEVEVIAWNKKTSTTHNIDKNQLKKYNKYRLKEGFEWI